MASVSGGLAGVKPPRSLRLLDGLPRNTMGKVRTNIQRDRDQSIPA